MTEEELIDVARQCGTVSAILASLRKAALNEGPDPLSIKMLYLMALDELKGSRGTYRRGRGVTTGEQLEDTKFIIDQSTRALSGLVVDIRLLALDKTVKQPNWIQLNALMIAATTATALMANRVRLHYARQAKQAAEMPGSDGA